MDAKQILVVGAGFAGAVSARALADAGYRILIIDQRNHIGGNAWDTYDDAGIQIHPYGPHIFHTNSDRVVEWLSKFTKWRGYEHKVLAQFDQKLYPIPINLTTVNQLYGLHLDEDGMNLFLEQVREKRDPILTSEDAVLNRVGKDLCEKFFRGYTRKQWGLDLSELDASVASRIPVRHNFDDRYFTDKYQLMPMEGFNSLFNRILDHPSIQIELGTSFDKINNLISPKHTFYTGQLDSYFKNCFGKLPYRSLRFEHQHISDLTNFQSVGTINYPNDNEFTRITEFKHLTGQKHNGTSIVREFPTDDGDPFYPVPHNNSYQLCKRYQSLVEKIHDVTFVGRLAQYRYFNMDQVVAAALSAVAKFMERDFD